LTMCSTCSIPSEVVVVVLLLCLPVQNTGNVMVPYLLFKKLCASALNLVWCGVVWCGVVYYAIVTVMATIVVC